MYHFSVHQMLWNIWKFQRSALLTIDSKIGVYVCVTTTKMLRGTTHSGAKYSPFMCDDFKPSSNEYWLFVISCMLVVSPAFLALAVIISILLSLHLPFQQRLENSCFHFHCNTWFRYLYSFFSKFLMFTPLKAVNGPCPLSLHMANHAGLLFQFLIWFKTAWSLLGVEVVAVSN